MADGAQNASTNLLWLLILLLPCGAFACVRCAAKVAFPRDKTTRGIARLASQRSMRPERPDFADKSLYGNVASRLGNATRREQQMAERIATLEARMEQLRRVNPELRRRVGDAGLAHKTTGALSEGVKEALHLADTPVDKIIRIASDPKTEKQARQVRRVHDVEAAIEALQLENRELKRILSQDAVLRSASPRKSKTHRKVFTLRRSGDATSSSPSSSARDVEEGLDGPETQVSNEDEGGDSLPRTGTHKQLEI